MSVSLPYLLPGWWGKWDSTSPSSGLWVSLPPLRHAIFALHNRPLYTIKMSPSLCLKLGEVPDWGSYFRTVGDSATQSSFPEVSCSLTEPLYVIGGRGTWDCRIGLCHPAFGCGNPE